MKAFMSKIYYLIFILIMFTHCSIDTKTGLWDNKNDIINNKKLSEINFDRNLSFNKFKENVILYGKQSEYPILMD